MNVRDTYLRGVVPMPLSEPVAPGRVGVPQAASAFDVEPMNLVMWATELGMPHSRDESGRLLFDLVEIDAWLRR